MLLARVNKINLDSCVKERNKYLAHALPINYNQKMIRTVGIMSSIEHSLNFQW